MFIYHLGKWKKKKGTRNFNSQIEAQLAIAIANSWSISSWEI